MKKKRIIRIIIFTLIIVTFVISNFFIIKQNVRIVPEVDNMVKIRCFNGAELLIYKEYSTYFKDSVSITKPEKFNSVEEFYKYQHSRFDADIFNEKFLSYNNKIKTGCDEYKPSLFAKIKLYVRKNLFIFSDNFRNKEWSEVKIYDINWGGIVLNEVLLISFYFLILFLIMKNNKNEVK